MLWDILVQEEFVQFMMQSYRPFLPTDKTAPILDIGFGNAQFIAACIALGYQNVYRHGIWRSRQPVVESIIPFGSVTSLM